MAKRQVNKKAQAKKEIEEAAKLAAEEALEEMEEAENFEDDGVSLSFGEQQDEFNADDVFEEGFKRAQSAKEAPRFHIKKNSQFLTVKDWPYSWEKLQAEYGGGYYQVICKGRSSGRIFKQQTESIAGPEEAKPAPQSDVIEAVTKQDGNMALLAMMNQFQERADERARIEAKSGESNMAQVMQTVVQMQQQTTTLMMTMMQESQKQTQNLIMSMMTQNSQKGPDPALTLLSSLLSKKDSGDGFTAAGVMKMIQDAEMRAETRATKNFELIEKKANELADIKAEALAGGEGDGDESFTKTLVKGFIPVLSQLATNQQNQLTPEQVAHQQMLAGRGPNAGLDQGFVDDGPVRPAIPAARPQRRPQPLNARPVQPPVTQPEEKKVVSEQEKGATVVQLPQDPVQLSRMKEQLFNFCAGDIGNAMMNREPASKTVETCLKKLEIEGVPRQTVVNLFELKDFYGYADQYGLPSEARTWLKDFHEALKTHVQPASASNPVAPVGDKPAPVPQTVKPAQRAVNVRARGGSGAVAENT